MKFNYMIVPAAILACSLMSGCVVGRRTVGLPVNKSPASEGTKGTFVVQGVSDERRFENKPAAPSTPSIDGDVNKTPKEQLATMIGRQRNTYGKALGDIALPAPETVETKMVEVIEEGLRRGGYTIGAPGSSANTASARINKFWAWGSPGMWSIGFEANLEAEITLVKDGKTVTFTVKGYAENRGQVASDANWQLAYSRAFDDFLKNFGTALEAQGL